MANPFTFRFRIDWRRGPREMTAALGEVRRRAIEEIAASIRADAPHPNIATRVSHSASQVTIAHSAAMFLEFGQSPGSFPPVDRIRQWAISVGKDPDSAFPLARSIKAKGRAAQPYIFPAIRAAMAEVPKHMRDIWEGGR